MFLKTLQEIVEELMGKKLIALLVFLGFSFLFFAEVCCPFELARVSSKL